MHNMVRFMGSRKNNFGGPPPGPPSPPTITYVGDTQSTSSSILMPNVAAGDIVFFFDRASNSSGAPTTVVNALFTQIGTSLVTATNHKRIISYRIVGAGEDGDSITGMNGTSSNSKVMVSFRTTGSWGIPAGFNEQGTTGNPNAQTITGGTGPLVAIANYLSSSAISPITFSPTQDDFVSGTSNFVYYKIQTVQADTTVDMDDEGSWNMMSSFYIPST